MAFSVSQGSVEIYVMWVGNTVKVLLKIPCWIKKNFENRSTYTEVMHECRLACFLTHSVEAATFDLLVCFEQYYSQLMVKVEKQKFLDFVNVTACLIFYFIYHCLLQSADTVMYYSRFSSDKQYAKKTKKNIHWYFGNQKLD